MSFTGGFGIALGSIGWFVVIFFSAMIVLGLLGWLMARHAAKKNASAKAEEDENVFYDKGEDYAFSL